MIIRLFTIFVFLACFVYLEGAEINPVITGSTGFNGLVAVNRITQPQPDYLEFFSYDSAIETPLTGSNNNLSTGEPSPNAKIWEIILPDVSGFLTSYDSHTLGIEGKATGYIFDRFLLKNTGYVEVYGDVTLVLRNGLAISGEIRINENSSLKIYTESDIDLAGDVVPDVSSNPKDFMIFGTTAQPKGQRISISTDDVFKAAIYAPNAEIYFSSYIGGYAGAIVCYDFYCVRPCWFSTDESLRDSYPFGDPRDWNLFRGFSTSFNKNNVITLSWDSVNWATYQIEYTLNLDQAFKAFPDANFDGTGNIMTWEYQIPNSLPKIFYRVRIL